MPESDLYEPILNWVKSDFRQGLGYRENSNFVALNVAELNWLNAPGTWMNPDLAFVHVHRRTFDPTPCLDLHIFEVKLGSSDLLQALHQTLAQGRIADFAYLVAPDSAGWSTQVLAQARRFGVGLVSFVRAADASSFTLKCEAKRNEPDPDFRNQFLESALAKSGQRSDVLRWLGLGE
jgi:hypothetical protein